MGCDDIWDSDAKHAGSFGGCNAIVGILEDNTLCWLNTQSLGSQ